MSYVKAVLVGLGISLMSQGQAYASSITLHSGPGRVVAAESIAARCTLTNLHKSEVLAGMNLFRENGNPAGVGAVFTIKPGGTVYSDPYVLETGSEFVHCKFDVRAKSRSIRVRAGLGIFKNNGDGAMELFQEALQ